MDNEKMVLVLDSHIENEDGRPLAYFVEGTDREVQIAMANSVAMKRSILDFIESVDSGKLHPKKAYNAFKEIL